MRVVDSSAWIKWLDDSTVADLLEHELPDQENFVVPTIVQHEVFKWLQREIGLDSAGGFIALTRQYRVVPLSTTIAVEAADLCRTHKLATADAIIYATAIHAGADLLTCDAHFKGLDRVVYLPKGD